MRIWILIVFPNKKNDFYDSPCIVSYRLVMHIEALRVIFMQIQEACIIFKMAAMAAILNFPKSKHVLQLGQRISTPNLVLIGATAWHALIKQKCDGRKDGRTEGRKEGRKDGGHFIVPLFLIRGTIMVPVVHYSKLSISGSILIKICIWIKNPDYIKVAQIMLFQGKLGPLQ